MDPNRKSGKLAFKRPDYPGFVLLPYSIEGHRVPRAGFYIDIWDSMIMKVVGHAILPMQNPPRDDLTEGEWRIARAITNNYDIDPSLIGFENARL